VFRPSPASAGVRRRALLPGARGLTGGIRWDRHRVRHELDRRGFVLVRALIPRDEIARMAAGFDRLLDLARTDPGDVGGARFVVDRSPFRLRRVVWCGGAEPALHPYGGDPRFVALAVEALGIDPVVQLVQQAHFKLPHDGVGFGWHQDASNRRYGTDLWTDVDGRGSFVQIALAIDPQGPGNGGLRFLPGSHRLGFVADPVTGAIPAVDESQAITPVLEPGDAVVFGPFLVHGSEPNASDGPRRLFLQGYAAPGANGRMYPGCGLGAVRSCAAR
jgi:hypothetical protein